MLQNPHSPVGEYPKEFSGIVHFYTESQMWLKCALSKQRSYTLYFVEQSQFQDIWMDLLAVYRSIRLQKFSTSIYFTNIKPSVNMEKPAQTRSVSQTRSVFKITRKQKNLTLILQTRCILTKRGIFFKSYLQYFLIQIPLNKICGFSKTS